MATSSLSQSFKHEQLKFPRVRAAYEETENGLKELFRQKNLSYPPGKIFIRIFKHEKVLELWVKPHSIDTFTLLREYPICALSGNAGPKRREGDGQTPEGFYTVDRFNPNSQFHLSLRLNYPNESDKILGVRGNLGGDIFIHGNCVTIGCIPITDDLIKELYVIAVDAKNGGGSDIPVHVFPCRLNDEGKSVLEKSIPRSDARWRFWGNIGEGYAFFEKNKRLPKVTVRKDGYYQIE